MPPRSSGRRAVPSPSRETTRSARCTSSARCAIRSTVRPGRSRSTASATTSALTGSRSAVGSSRITKGASRRNARASAIRRRSPAESGLPPSPTSVSYPEGSARTKWSAPASIAPRGSEPSDARGAPRRMLSATVPRKIVGRCGTQASRRRQTSVRHSARSMLADRDAAGDRVGEAQEEARDGALSRSARADEGDGLAGQQLEVERVEDEVGSRGVGERDLLQANGCVRRTGRDEPPPAPHRCGCLEQPEQAVGDGQSVGAGVELGSELAQRSVELRREDEDGQPGPQTEAALHEAHADRDRDQGHPERGRQLEHGSREKGDAQRAHRGLSVALAHLLDRRRLRAASVEGAQRG